MPRDRGRRLPVNVQIWITQLEETQRTYAPPLRGEPPLLPEKRYKSIELERYRRSVRNHHRYMSWWLRDYKELEKKFLAIYDTSTTVADKVAIIDDLVHRDHEHGVLRHLSTNAVFYIHPERLQRQRAALLASRQGT